MFFLLRLSPVVGRIVLFYTFIFLRRPLAKRALFFFWS